MVNEAKLSDFEHILNSSQ